MLLLLPLLIPAPSVQAGEHEILEDRALAPVAEALAAYGESLGDERKVEKRRREFEESLVEVFGTEAPLSDPRSLGRAVWLARSDERIRARKGKVDDQTRREPALPDGELEYAFRVPRDYSPKNTAYPLILSLPEPGVDPEAHILEEWSSSDVRKNAIVFVPAMPEAKEDWDRPMVDGKPGPLAVVLTALRVSKAEFAVDDSRVFLVGRGENVAAAIAAANYAPEHFAGVVGRSGDPGKLPPENFAHIPTLFLGGGANARAFQEAAQELGFENCELNPTGREEDAWSWMFERRRDDFPRETRVLEGLAYPTRNHWLDTSAMAPDARATAQIDHLTNSILIESEGVAYVTLYLNDALIDLNRPVRFVRNKVESVRMVERRVPVMLELLRRGISDSSCVYVAEVVLDMRSEAESDHDPRPGDSEFRERLELAGTSIDALWKLHEWCVETERVSESRVALRRLLRNAPDNARAREAFGQVAVDSSWFPSETFARQYRESQDEAVATERAYVKHRDVWLHPAERPLSSKGLQKDPRTGLWNSAADRRRLEKGWVRADFEWIEPDQVDRLDDGLWPVDGEWVAVSEAERRHSRIDRMWDIPGPAFRLHTTVPRQVAERANEHMARALDDLRRVFRHEPALPLEVCLLAYEEQYDRFAFGSADGRRGGTHAGQLHILHSAFFAESNFERVKREFRFRGMGVGYWNTEAPYGDAYGVHSARLAAGLSFVEALDPSPEAVDKAESKGPGASFYADYLAEKSLPRWFRIGGAVYAERYFEDRHVAEGGDPWWARKWSIENLTAKGGLMELDALFAFELDEAEGDQGLRMLIQAGLLVAFTIDGGCEPVAAAHRELTSAFREGRLKPEHVQNYERALVDHERELLEFMGTGEDQSDG